MSPQHARVYWYLRSVSDADTHCGELRPHGLVYAQCGAVFRPRPLPFDRLALPGQPLDPSQICPQCRTARVPANPTGED
jgi:hypothetical protein